MNVLLEDIDKEQVFIEKIIRKDKSLIDLLPFEKRS